MFCWLWDNHEGIVHAMERHGLMWDSIAHIATEDGVKGRWGKPPTGNAMHRVWGRMCPQLGSGGRGSSGSGTGFRRSTAFAAPKGLPTKLVPVPFRGMNIKCRMFLFDLVTCAML